MDVDQTHAPPAPPSRTEMPEFVSQYWPLAQKEQDKKDIKIETLRLKTSKDYNN